MRRINHNIRAAVKEAFDNLPGGICFFNEKGILVLCNHAMYRLVFALTGRDLQSMYELQDALQNRTEYKAADGGTVLLQDGTAWKFAFTEVESPNGIRYTQIIAFDVTELYNGSKEFAQKNKELEEMAQHIENITKNVVAIMREEEILSMKMRIHNEVGSSVLNTRRYYLGGCLPEQKEELLRNWRRTVSLLHNEIGKDDETDVYGELLEIASSIGVEIIQTGELPQESACAYLIVASIRECLTNTIRHAEGNKLFVTISQNTENAAAVITNNGKVPAGEITEGGGLSSLRTRIEKAGGTMQVQSKPAFALTITVPLKGEDTV